jgi:Spy/CpxP family protein refolding chaperone
MWKSKKFIILGVVLAVVLVIVATAGIALAQDPKPGAGPGQEIMARVAQILGIDQQKLTDAFKKATTEYRTAHPRPTIDERLAQLVKDGKITQEQANQIKAWEAKKPADPKANPQQFQDWMKSRPNIQLPKPDGAPGPGLAPHFRFPFGGPKPPPAK